MCTARRLRNIFLQEPQSWSCLHIEVRLRLRSPSQRVHESLDGTGRAGINPEILTLTCIVSKVNLVVLQFAQPALTHQTLGVQHENLLPALLDGLPRFDLRNTKSYHDVVRAASASSGYPSLEWENC